MVLGAAGLIGSGMSAELVGCGARVLAVDIAHEAESQSRPGVETYHCDITDPVQRGELARRVSDGAARYFVHSAGGHKWHPGQYPDPFEWFAHHDVHLYSPVQLGYEFFRARHERGLTGSAVFISSVHARYLYNDAVYSSAKAGLEMAVRELARESADAGSRVNLVAPGHVTAEPMRSLPTRLGRISLRPEAIALAVRFLLCDDCSPFTAGSVLQVDGGLGLWAPWGPE